MSPRPRRHYATRTSQIDQARWCIFVDGLVFETARSDPGRHHINLNGFADESNGSRAANIILNARCGVQRIHFVIVGAVDRDDNEKPDERESGQVLAMTIHSVMRWVAK